MTATVHHLGPRTWEQAMPLLIEVLINGTPQGQQDARAELMRLAKAVDKSNARVKNNEV